MPFETGNQSDSLHAPVESLSPKQRYVYDTYVVTALEKRAEEIEDQRIKDSDRVRNRHLLIKIEA